MLITSLSLLPKSQKTADVCNFAENLPQMLADTVERHIDNWLKSSLHLLKIFLLSCVFEYESLVVKRIVCPAECSFGS